MKKQIGIWLDFKKASIVELKGENVRNSKIMSEIDTYHPKGGARSKSPWGPMDKISERKYLERRKHQEMAYFQRLMEAVKDVDELYIFGPAEAKDKLAKVIKESYNFHPKLRGVERADSMTEKQKIKKVRAFFGGA